MTHLPPAELRKVVALVYDRLSAFEFGIAHEVFGRSRPEFENWYRFSTCSMDAGPLELCGGLRLEVSGTLRRLDHAGTIVIPGWRDADEDPPPEVLHKLRRAHARGARLVSVCTGVFVLAAAGLLDGRRATTHWRYTERLASRYPSIRVDPNVLYVDEGSILTSAGSAAGIDLCLHLVRRDFGATIANQIARRMVVPPHRDGGQAQFIDITVRDEDEEGLARLLEWLRRNLKRSLTVDAIARRARMSKRTLARRFQETLGMSPHVWLTRERVRRAEQMLETTDHSIDRIASDSGLGSAQLVRRHFRHFLGTTPTAFRRNFRHRKS
jgi:AraC family transcriptional activator FtrA